MRPSDRSDTELVLAARSDDGEAFGELFDRWFSSSWNVARTIVRHDDLAADVAQDALLAAWQRLDQLDNPEAFGGWLLRITRNRALTRLEREQRSRATGDDVVSGLRDRGLPDPTGAEPPLAPDSISEVRDRQELVWAAAAALGEREVSLLDLHLRHGLTPAEIAEELGVAANNAHQQLFRLRNRLGDAIGSYLLWRNGRPLCDGLAAAVDGDVAFDRSVARAVSRHQASCEYCSERRASLIDPGKLFAGVPLVLVPAQFKVQAAAALQSAGVPLGSQTGAAPGAESGGTESPSSPSGSESPSSPSGSESPSSPSGSESPHPASGSDFGRSASTDSAAADANPDHRLAMAAKGAAGSNTGTLAKGGAAVLAVAALLVVIALAGPGLIGGGGGETLAAIDSEPAPTGASVEGQPDEASLGSSEPGNGSDQAGSSQDLAPGGPTRSTAPPPDPVAPSPNESTAPVASTTRTTATTPSTPSSTTANPVTTSASTPSTTQTTTSTTAGQISTVSTTGTTATTRPTDSTPRTTPTTSPPGPPVIIRFTSGRLSGVRLCADPNQGPFEASWSTENTDSVTLTMPNGTHQGPPSGTYQFCASTGDTIRLLASGPGGQDKAATTL